MTRLSYWQRPAPQESIGPAEEVVVEIGKPERVIHVEPVEDPVTTPATAPAEPAEQPERETVGV